MAKANVQIVALFAGLFFRSASFQALLAPER